MCGIACGITTLVLGALLVISTSIVGFGLIDGIIESVISEEVALHDNTIQLERFKETPFPLNFTVRIFNITNPDDVLAGGIPVMNEVGPYIYKLYKTRSVIGRDAETIQYRVLDRYEFDVEGSYPCTEDDLLTVVNVPYHAIFQVAQSEYLFRADAAAQPLYLLAIANWAILQVAESEYPELMLPLSLGLRGVFGALNAPVVTVRARDLLLDGLPLCVDAGIAGGIACTAIRAIAASSQNMAVQPDRSILFSLFGYRDGKPSQSFQVKRGVDNARDLGRILRFADSARLRHWPEGDHGSIAENLPNICNMINGTDSAVYPPFIDREQSIYAFKYDICRSVELHYQFDHEVARVGVVRYAANEWLLDNHQGCFCLNLTRGVTGADGCLLKGAMELFSCVGGFLVMSNPHFLYADPAYQNGVIGMTPDVEKHRIFMDLEPKTGIVIRGASRAQFNIFMRPIKRISATSTLSTVLTPIFWVEEGMLLPDEYMNELKERLLEPLRLVDIVVPVLVATSSVVFLLGVGLTVRARLNRPSESNAK